MRSGSNTEDPHCKSSCDDLVARTSCVGAKSSQHESQAYCYVQRVDLTKYTSDLGDDSLFGVLFDLLPDAALIVNEDGLITATNRRAGEMFGYESGELLGKSIEILVPASYAKKHTAVRQEFLSNASKRFMGFNRPTLQAQRKDGTTFPVDIALSPACRNGRPITLTVARDMTERVAMAEQIRRTQRLDAIGKLSSGVAHDFNNALGVIQMNLEVARDRAKNDPTTVEYIDRGLVAAKLGATVTARLLAFAREQILEPTIVKIDEHVAKVVTLLRHSLGERIAVEENYSDDAWSCMVDASQLENAIINLAINARDAMPSGGTMTFRVSNKTFSEPTAALQLGIALGDYVSIEVDDTGTGFTPDAAQRAFEPFFSTKGPGKGTGLGLSIIYGFAAQSAGYARLHNKVNGGAIAEILLPRAYAKKVPGDLRQAGNAACAGNENRKGVLLVDDDADLRHAVSEILSLYDCDVTTANGTAEAVQALLINPHISVLLTDLRLGPAQSGYDLAQRALRVRPKLSVVFMSGFADAHEMPADLVGAAQILHKPFEVDELEKALSIKRGCGGH